MSRKKRQRRAVLKRRARKLKRLYRSDCQRLKATISLIDAPHLTRPLGWRFPDGYGLLQIPAHLTPRQQLLAIEKGFAMLEEKFGTPERAEASIAEAKQFYRDLIAWGKGGPRPSWLAPSSPGNQGHQGGPEGGSL